MLACMRKTKIKQIFYINTMYSVCEVGWTQMDKEGGEENVKYVFFYPILLNICTVSNYSFSYLRDVS